MKTHLFLPSPADSSSLTMTLCSRTSGKVSTDVELVDCETCKQRYSNNQEWYAAAIRRWQHGTCKNCGDVIEVMAYRRTGACCEICKDAIEGKKT